MLRLTLLLFVLRATTLHAQQATVATGGNATGTGGSASYSVGQPAYTTLSAAGGSVAQGVQQPYEISTDTSVGERDGFFILTAAPNPATDVLELAAAGPLPARTRYHLRNTAGQLLANAPITGERTRIAMNGLAPGIYLLEVASPDGPLRSFRIVKH